MYGDKNNQSVRPMLGARTKEDGLRTENKEHGVTKSEDERPLVDDCGTHNTDNVWITIEAT